MRVVKRVRDGKIYTSMRACALENRLTEWQVEKLANKGEVFLFMDKSELTAKEIFEAGGWAVYDTYDKKYYRTYKEAGEVEGITKQAVFDNHRRYVRICGKDFQNK